MCPHKIALPHLNLFAHRVWHVHIWEAWFVDVYLVGGFNPSEKYARQIGSFPQVGAKIKNVWNHHPAMISNDSPSCNNKTSTRWWLVHHPLDGSCSSSFSKQKSSDKKNTNTQLETTKIPQQFPPPHPPRKTQHHFFQRTRCIKGRFHYKIHRNDPWSLFSSILSKL